MRNRCLQRIGGERSQTNKRWEYRTLAVSGSSIHHYSTTFDTDTTIQSQRKNMALLRCAYLRISNRFLIFYANQCHQESDGIRPKLIERILNLPQPQHHNITTITVSTNNGFLWRASRTYILRVSFILSSLSPLFCRAWKRIAERTQVLSGVGNPSLLCRSIYRR